VSRFERVLIFILGWVLLRRAPIALLVSLWSGTGAPFCI
jgi:hypothetical protein